MMVGSSHIFPGGMVLSDTPGIPDMKRFLKHECFKKELPSCSAVFVLSVTRNSTLKTLKYFVCPRDNRCPGAKTVA